MVLCSLESSVLQLDETGGKVRAVPEKRCVLILREIPKNTPEKVYIYVCIPRRLYACSCVSTTHYGVVVKSRPSSLSTVQYCDLSSCIHCVVFCVLFQDITALFASDKCPNYSSCEFADNDCWYITFDSEEDTQKVRVHVWCVHVVCTLFFYGCESGTSLCT